MDGILVCDKPAGPTSHDVVARVRRLAGQRRVGHAGTLDPPATGVLVVALGRATRLLQYLPLEPKRYRATVRLGSATDTLDAVGVVTATARADHVDEAAFRAALVPFVGTQDQIPPMVSALKVGGERLHAKARRGEEVERAPRRITMHALDLVAFDPSGTGAGLPTDAAPHPNPAASASPAAAGHQDPVPAGASRPAVSGPLAVVDVTCSGGTYVRSLADDLGRALGAVAHLSSLRRTGVGRFDLDMAHTFADLDATAATSSGLAGLLLTPANAFDPAALRTLDPDETAALAVGRPLSPTGRPGPVAAVAPDGRLIAVVVDEQGRARPQVVLA